MLGAHRPVERAQHRVEAPSEAAELVAPRLVDHRRKVVGRGNVFGRRSQPTHRCDSGPRDKPAEQRGERDPDRRDDEQNHAQVRQRRGLLTQ
jgi:hypothetical protein